MKVLSQATATVLLASTLNFTVTSTAQAAAEPLLGEIMWFAPNFCPRGWAEAAGQLLPISQNQALFSLIGTIYGGDGRTTFALPDLRGRSSIASGQGPGLSSFVMGQRGGTETVNITTSQMPTHNHAVTLNATTEVGNSDSPADAVLAYKNRSKNFNDALSSNTAMDASSISQNNIGGNQPVAIRSPFLTMKACIAIQGIFPSRN